MAKASPSSTISAPLPGAPASGAARFHSVRKGVLITARRLFPAFVLACASGLQAQRNSYLDSTRPTISSDAAIQQRGVLQIESGYDGYFLPFDQTVATSLYFAATNWLRLDASLDGFRSKNQDSGQRTSGLGTSSFGAKLVLFHDGRSRTVPGIAVEYEDTLATASRDALQSRYHQGTFILSNSYGPWRWKLNGSAIGSGCNGSDGCSVHGQGALGLSWSLNHTTTLASEFFGQTNSVSAPAGAYAFAGASRQLNPHTSLNGGLRFGVTPNAPRIGLTLGLTIALGGHPHPS